MSNNNGLWTQEFGQIGAFLKALQDQGLTLDGCKEVRKNPEAAKVMVDALQAFLPASSLHPDNYYDLSAVLGFAAPLQNIQWPNVELAEDQFLVAYRGESPAQVLPHGTTKVKYRANGFPNNKWWNQGKRSGIYLLTMRESYPYKKYRNSQFYNPVDPLIPFVLNVMVRLAHKAITGRYAGGWSVCDEDTSHGCWATVTWDDEQLVCNYESRDRVYDFSTYKRLSDLE